jgi:uncharacterized membrane protein
MLRAAWQSRALGVTSRYGPPMGSSHTLPCLLPSLLPRPCWAHAALLACVALGRGLDLEGASTPHLTDDSGMDSEKVVVEVC